MVQNSSSWVLNYWVHSEWINRGVRKALIKIYRIKIVYWGSLPPVCKMLYKHVIWKTLLEQLLKRHNKVKSETKSTEYLLKVVAEIW